MDEKVVALHTAGSVCTRETASLGAGYVDALRTLEIILVQVKLRDWPRRTEVN
jgi:hypothetical protein